jgi:hypothetical protein
MEKQTDYRLGWRTTAQLVLPHIRRANGTVMRGNDDSQRGVADERRWAWGEKYRPRYRGVATFMRRPLLEEPEQWEGVEIGLIGVPFDGHSGSGVRLQLMGQLTSASV